MIDLWALVNICRKHQDRGWVVVPAHWLQQYEDAVRIPARPEQRFDLGRGHGVVIPARPAAPWFTGPNDYPICQGVELIPWPPQSPAS